MDTYQWLWNKQHKQSTCSASHSHPVHNAMLPMHASSDLVLNGQLAHRHDWYQTSQALVAANNSVAQARSFTSLPSSLTSRGTAQASRMAVLFASLPDAKALRASAEAAVTASKGMASSSFTKRGMPYCSLEATQTYSKARISGKFQELMLPDRIGLLPCRAHIRLAYGCASLCPLPVSLGAGTDY